jgi:hypothetical protein
MEWRSQIMTARCGTCRFVAFRSSVVAVQSVVRGRAARRRFLALRQATITAQKLWRGRCVRRMLCTQKAAATLLLHFLHTMHCSGVPVLWTLSHTSDLMDKWSARVVPVIFKSRLTAPNMEVA